MDLEVRRDDLHTTRWNDSGPPGLDDGETLLRTSMFSLTSNNVTYAVFGDAMAYWQFFPAAAGWGRVPVWGYADVEASRSDLLREGERIYGYLPMGSHLVVTPSHATEAGFVDATEHRASLPPAYNRYQRVAGEPSQDPKREREYALLRPLFFTGFLLDDWLDDSGVDVTRVVLASASSKTALALAFLQSQRDGVEVVGLTSPANLGFVESVGYYDRVVTYDAVTDLEGSSPTAYVDMAGSAAVRGAVHHHLADSLVTSCAVGATHWSETGGGGELPGPAPTFFFAPDRITKRAADWGPDGLDSRLGAAWTDFLGSVDGWLEIVERQGPGEVEATWLEVLDGGAPPARGYVLSLP